MTNIEIPREIDSGEYLSRIILHSFHFSHKKNKIKPEAFLPSPSEGDEISVIRYNYSDISIIKQRGLQIAHTRNTIKNPCTFIGVAFLTAESVIHAPIGNESSETLFTATPISSPLDSLNNLRTESPIFKSDEGLPSHADIKYNVNIIEHRPLSQKFKLHVLKPLVRAVNGNFFKDNIITSEDWYGDEINLDATK